MAQILVVDDEPDVRELFNITLKMAGHQTETAKDGVEAADKLAQRTPDLILLDLMMPRMDGFAFLSHVRKKHERDALRILVATAKVLEDDDRQKLASWPVVGVLNKGDMDVMKMVGAVSSALDRSPTRPDAGLKPAGAPASQPSESAQAPASSAPAPPEPARQSGGLAGGAAPPARPLGESRSGEKHEPGNWLPGRKLW